MLYFGCFYTLWSLFFKRDKLYYSFYYLYLLIILLLLLMNFVLSDFIHPIVTSRKSQNSEFCSYMCSSNCHFFVSPVSIGVFQACGFLWLSLFQFIIYHIMYFNAFFILWVIFVIYFLLSSTSTFILRILYYMFIPPSYVLCYSWAM